MPCTPYSNWQQKLFPIFYPCFQRPISRESTADAGMKPCPNSGARAVINIIPILFYHCCSERLAGLSQTESIDHEDDDV